MSITTMMKDADFYTAGALVYARSKDLEHWEIGDVYYNPGNHGYPECSDLFEMGGRHYVLMSIFHKTVYRFGPTIHGPWQTGRTDSFDGVMNYAAKSLGENDKRFVIGWIRTRLGRRDSGNWEWGGHMAFPRQVVQDSDGTLYSKLPEQFSALRGEELCSTDNGGAATPVYGTWQAETRGGQRLHSSPLYGELRLGANASAFDLELEFTLDAGTRCGGLIFGANQTNHPGYEVCVDMRTQQMLIRKHGERFTRYVCQDVHVRPGELMRLRVIVEEDMVEAFLNDRYALASRCYQVGDNAPLGFFIEEGSGALVRASVCALAETPSLVLAGGS
jgi:beta-fructofuranosidase